jgi:hypothetical protein
MIKYGFKLPKSVKNVFYAAFTMFFFEKQKSHSFTGMAFSKVFINN